MKKFILASLILASSQMAVAVYWINAYAGSAEHKETTYIDLDSIQGFYFNSYDKNGYYVTAWVKKVYPTAQKLNNGKLYREEKSYWYVDCLNHKFTVEEAIYHTSKGKFVGSQKDYISKYSSDNWSRIVPDSVGHTISNAICIVYDVKTNPNYYNKK